MAIRASTAGDGTSSPRMALAVDGEQLGQVQMGVFLGRPQAFVAEQLRMTRKIGPPAEEMGSERMPKEWGLIFLRMAVFLIYLATSRSTERDVIRPPR